MVDIYPFRGLRYNLKRLTDEGHSLEAVATPPYDVINDAQQKALYARHPHNFVRLDLNRKTPDDNAENNPYTRAAHLIKAWEQEGVLVAEDQPAVYAYSQSWTDGAETILRRGLLAVLKLEDLASGNVLPHEHTLKGPKQDRLQLMHSTQCNLSQVFFIYSDPERQMEKLIYDQAKPNPTEVATVIDPDGVEHRFYPVIESTTLQALQTLFQNKSLLIADGHHRYETALGYQAEIREAYQHQHGHEAEPGSLLSDYAVVFLTNMDDPGLKVYPTHRILEAWPEGWDQTRFETELFARFETVQQDATFEYRRPDTDERIKLRLKETAKPHNLPDLLDSFDAAILETVVFQGIFGTTGEALKQAHQLGFHRNNPEIETLWNNHQAVAGFYLAAPSVKLVHQICQAGHRMPQKSTYFYPKILSGLMIYPYRHFLNSSKNALSGVLEAHSFDSEVKTTATSGGFTQRPY